MASIKELYQQALLSDAAYANFLSPGGALITGPEELIVALRNSGFETSLAQTFAQKWRVASQFSESGMLSNGFSGTLFERLDDNQQRTGQYTLAFRGSDDRADFVGADVDLAFTSVARNQLISMVNYVRRLEVGEAGNSVSQLNAVGSGLAPNLSPGVGPGITAGSLTVTGHSLGGYLAQVYQRIFGSAGVFTFNALGITNTNASFFNQVTTIFGLAPGAFGSGAGENLVVRGEPARSIGSVQGKAQIEIFSESEASQQNPLNVDVLAAHLMGFVTDSLAVYDLFATVSPSLSTSTPAIGINKITSILRAMSNDSTQSLDSAVNALNDFFRLGFTPISSITTGTPVLLQIPLGRIKADHDTLHQVLVPMKQTLLSLLENTPLTIDSLVTGTTEHFETADNLVLLASGSDALAYRYALRNLNPFAITGDDSFYDDHNENGELDLYDAETREGDISSHWLMDRAQMLAFSMTANTNDARSFASTEISDQVRYTDLRVSATAAGGDFVVHMLGGTANFNGPNTRRITFGSELGEYIRGRENTDRLYGEGGTDYLQGNRGDDYLEGGRGMDVYEYNGRTSLLGSDTNDGNDTILDTDGKGVLRYVFNDGGGLFGLGATSASTIIHDASNRISDTEWSSADGKFDYERSGADLIVTVDGDSGGQITLKDFKDGDYGIYLFEEEREAPETTREIFGDKEYTEETGQIAQQKGPGGVPLAYGDPNFFGPNLFKAYEVLALDEPIPEDWLNPQLESEYVLHHTVVNGSATTEFYALPATLDFLYNPADDLGNVITTEEDDPDIEDQLYDSVDNDLIVAGGGNDNIDAFRGGHDIIDAGEGRDVVNAGGGNDIVEGGDDGAVLLGSAGLVYGGDMVAGGAGDDELYGDLKVTLADAIQNGEDNEATDTIGDFLSGGDGNDWIVSGSANDLLLGGDGDDILVGGAGDDNLFGDRNNTAPDAGWSITRDVSVNETEINFSTNLIGTTAIEDGVGGRDVIYGGAGDDWALSGAGDDFIDGGSGEDVLFGGEGSDVIIGGEGDDILAGDDLTIVYELQGSDFLDGGAGDDLLFGYAGDDVLVGDTGDDVLRGGDGNDILIGGKGVDQLIGGAGKDTYVFNRGDGFEIIVDSSNAPGESEASVLVLGDGISRGDVKFRKGSLLIDLGFSDPEDPLGTADQIHFVNFNGDFPEQSASIGEIHFADGSLMTYAEILEQGFDIDGTVFDDAAGTALIGTSVTDRIRGFSGGDQLEGRDGDDVLTGDDGEDRLDGGNGNDLLNGGSGADLLAGGLGSDDYLFNSGDGMDSLIEGSLFVRGLSDPNHTDRVLFSEDIAREDVSLQRTADGNLTIRYGIGDEILIEGQYGLPGAEIEEIAFHDGEKITKAELDALEIGVVDGTADGDEIYGSTGNDVLNGLEGDDYLDGGPTPERRFSGVRSVTGDDVLDGGSGADTYALHWGMGNDLVIDENDDLSNTLKLLNGATFDSVKTTRNGDDLLVTLRGAGGSARVQDYFVNGSAESWQIQSEADGTQSLLDLYTAQNSENGGYVIDLMEDYKQGLLGEWKSLSQPSDSLPTHVYVNSTWTQTISFWEKVTFMFPNYVQETIMHTNDPVEHTRISAYSVRQNGRFIYLPNNSSTVTQRNILPVVVETNVDDEFIEAQETPSLSINSLLYSFNAGGGGPFSNLRSYSYSNGSMVNVVFVSGAEGWVPLVLRERGDGQFNLRIDQVTDSPVVEKITAGASNNSIAGAVENDPNHVALIDAGAGEDVVTAGQYDFVFGNDGDDEINGGVYAFGGNGYDSLFDGRFMSGGADDDFLSGGEGETTFSFRSDDAGSDWVQDQHGISLVEFSLRAGFSDSPSNFVYSGKYRLGGESSLDFQLALERRFGGRNSDAYQNLFSALTRAEFDFGDGRIQQYPLLPAPGFPRGVSDPFFRGPYSSDGYRTWVYNSVEDIMRDYAALGLQFNPADVSLIPGVPDLSDFTADNYSALQPFFESGVLKKDVVDLSDFDINAYDLQVGFAPLGDSFTGRRALRLVWGEDKVINIELSSAEDLIGHGVEEVRLGGSTSLYIGELVEQAEIEGILGTPFEDGIVGTDGDDVIRGIGGWDFIEGGMGADTLSGGAGGDEFWFELGAGSDTILDPDSEDLITFGNDIEPEQIRLGLGLDSLRIGYGTEGDEIYLSGFDANDVYGSELFSALQFWSYEEEELPDGSFEAIWTLRDELTYEEVLSQGFDIDGTSDVDVLTGTNIHDRFEGGAGNDSHAGGAGSDTYYFNAGDGVDTVVDLTESGETNRVVLRDYLASDITGFRSGQYIVLQADGTGDEVRILWDDEEGAGVDFVEFSDGSTWDRAYLSQLEEGENSSPVVETPIAPISTAEDAAFNFVVPSDTFVDPDEGDVLEYSAVLDDGSDLPSWLSFDAETHTFSGTPLQADVGIVDVKVIAIDSGGLTASEAFSLTVTNVNDIPVVTAVDGLVLLDDAVAATSLFSVTDEDGTEPVSYEFWDSTAGNGYFSVDGVAGGANVAISVTAEQLADTEFVGASEASADQVWVRAYDGESWSAWKSWTMSSWPHLTNSAPMITALPGEVLQDQTIAASSLFSVMDADDDAVTQYEFWDDVSGGGYFALDGVAQGSNPVVIDAAELADFEYVGGSSPGTEQVWVRASDGLEWGAWKAWNMTTALHIPNAAPEVMVDALQTLLLDEAVDVDTLFTVADADADPVAKYEFFDSTAGNGYFTVNGVEAGTNVAIPVLAADLENIQFHASETTGTDQVWVRASDGQTWGDWKSWNINSWSHLTNSAPVITAANASVLTGDAVAADSLFAVADSDSDTTVQYEFWDDVSGGGYFSVNGVQQAAGQTIAVSAADLLNTDYVAGANPGVEQVWVRANDGLEWGEWKSWQMTSALHLSNAAPVVTVSDQTLLLDEAVDADTLFTVADADSDPVTQYEFYDSTAGNGYFTVDGVAAGTNVAIPVTAANLEDVQFHASETTGSDQVWVRASDGQTWGDWKSWNINSWPHLTNAAPVVLAQAGGILKNDSVAADMLFSVTDGDSDSMTRYEFWDDLNGGGHWAVDGVQQAAGQTIAVDAADLGNTTYVGGANAGTEQVWARAWDGMTWSTWKSWLMSTEGGLIRGSTGPDTLNGEAGPTILEGGDDNDILTDTDGNNVLIGGSGNDTSTGGSGNDLFIGGAGSDTAHTGAGSNVIAYNAGGGIDTVYADSGAENTLSLGGGLKYSDLSLSRDNDDLVLNTGEDDKIVFKDWYAGQNSLLNLQLVLDATDEFDENSIDSLYSKRVQNFDFLGLVSEFDTAQAGNPGITNWALSDALTQYHLSGSDDAALGGDLAYWYARNNGLTGMSVAAAQQVIGASGFGADAQTLHAFSGLQDGFVRLS